MVFNSSAERLPQHQLGNFLTMWFPRHHSKRIGSSKFWGKLRSQCIYKTPDDSDALTVTVTSNLFRGFRNSDCIHRNLIKHFRNSDCIRYPEAQVGKIQVSHS